MAQNRSSVKLFGKIIELLVAEDDDDGEHKELKNLPDHKRPKSEAQDRDQESFASEESGRTDGTGENHTTEVPEDNESLTPTAHVPNQDDVREKGCEDASNLQDRTLEKPDKILPCPRCNSSDTKFCYFNNYSVNQPRYFCRNCQRYWTAGGSMRNVPVGAGCRKSKSSATFRYHKISVTTPYARVPTVRSEDPCPTRSVVLSYGQNVVLCEPSVMPNCSGRRKVDDHSCRSSVSASNGGEDTYRMQKLQQDSIGPPRIYPWNPSSPSISPISFSAAPTQGACSIPWRQPYQIAPFTTTRSTASTANSPLGKNSREGNILKHGSNLDKDADRKCVWNPRKLRIDGPDEAAKSSIWLMEPNDMCNGFSRGELFKAFHPEERTSPMIFHPNPAAMSRSLSFRESM